jgi:N-methylhydantoinase A
VTLDVTAARGVMSAIGALLGLDVEAVGAGIIEVVDTHMERALRAVSLEEGVDPRDSVLVAFGGAGGLHASRLARRLGMRKTLIPPLSGVFSALGLLLARPSSDANKTVMLDEGSALLESVAVAIQAEARDTYSMDHGSTGVGSVVRGEVRYVGQSHELDVPLTTSWAETRRTFEGEHLARFGFTRETQPIELVNVSAVVTGEAPLRWSDLPSLPARNRPVATRSLTRLGNRTIEVDVWKRSELSPEFETKGPAIIVEADSAVWLEPEDTMVVHQDGTLEIAS